MEKVLGRFRTKTELITGIYSSEHKTSKHDEFDSIRRRTNDFAAKHGRRPRILIAKIGQNGQDKRSKIIATAFADFGFDVDLSPMFVTPEAAAIMAVDNDVHAIGILSLDATRKDIVPAVTVELKKLGCPEIKVFIEEIVPNSDLLKCANEVLNELNINKA
ncbi:MAG: hypothetical protein WCR55_00580 [Lentisphaerota bacterium]